MATPDETVHRALECANRVAGTALSLPPGGDVPLEEFRFDSLSTFAFILELESTCGIAFDEALLELGRARTIRSLAALIASRPSQQSDRFREVGSDQLGQPYSAESALGK